MKFRLSAELASEREKLKMPERIQLRRVKGWKMPPNTVKVDRTTKWGNPFVVGKDGTQADCVYLYRMLAGGLLCMTTRGNQDAQVAARKAMEQARDQLRGKNLACWCRPGTPCHADVLLELANHPKSAARVAGPPGLSCSAACRHTNGKSQ